MDERLIPVKKAITDRKLHSLTAAVNDLACDESHGDAHKLIQEFILPTLNPAEIEWFWNSIASPVQSERVINLILQDAAMLLTKRGYKIGQDFSFATGRRRLLLSKAARETLEEVLPRRKRVMLSLVTKENHVKG